MKLIIQIPCFNEEETLPATLRDLPRHIPQIDQIETLVIDDGSTDRTVEVARQHGVHHIVSHPTNKGLAAAFKTGLEAALERGADIIVNTDGDNQYPGAAIPDLVRPVLLGQADIVVGDRQTDTIPHFSAAKKLLQKAGSAVVRYVSGTNIPDAPSGFRAYSREAALQTHVFTGFIYTLETVIQAGKKHLTITYVPITTNPHTRESRLFRSILGYIWRSAGTILRLFLLYEPLRTFSYASVPFFAMGLILWGRFLVLMLRGLSTRGANVQSIIVGSVALIAGALVLLLGLLGELLAINRRMNEELLYRLKKIQYRQEH